jgi:glycosyltransferase involved in cell wall biosynthesis
VSDNPRLSIIVPVRDGAATLKACLDAIEASREDGDEVIVVDDGCRDGTAALLARREGIVVLRNETSRGAFAARNQAAAKANGDVLFFTDADVEIHASTLPRLRLHFAQPACQAVIGLYSMRQPDRGAVTRYKNAWIRYSYLAAPAEVDWFFTAVGAVRRELWEACGGFGERFERDTGGGDLDFGRRLRRIGVRIALDKSLEVTHRRRFTLAALLRNDFLRAWGWAHLGMREAGVAGSAQGGIANVSRSFLASVALSGLVLAAIVAAPIGVLGEGPFLLLAAAYAASNAPFVAWLAREEGAAMGLAGLFIGFVDHLACGFGVAAALAARVLGLKPVSRN